MTEPGAERAIGRIEGKLDRLIDEGDKARLDRQRQYERLEKVERSLEQTDRTLKSVDARIKFVEEPVAEFNRWRERFIGMQMLIIFAASTIGGALVALWKWISVKLGIS